MPDSDHADPAPLLSARFDRALVFATQLHVTQRRKGTRIPYIAHLLAVAALVLEHGGTEDEAIAALLHDAVEDQGGADTRTRISSLFGENVATIVDGCSDTDETPKPPWHARKESYIEHLAGASPSVHLVSLADKVHNANSILQAYRTEGARVWERFNAGRDDQLWYYRALLETFRAAGTAPLLVQELDRIVSTLERESAPDHIVR